MKKASANMWWIIIGAVLALVVMIVLLTLFSGGTQKVEKGLLDCESKGGQCVSGGTCEGTVSKAFDCPNNKPDCCFSSKKSRKVA